MATPQPLPQHPDLMTLDQLSTWVQCLVDDQVPEGLVLDYKAEVYSLASQRGKAELAKDVTSFANTQGGTILVGIRERTDAEGRNTKLPEASYGVSEQPQYAERIRDILASVVSPVLPQLRVVWIPRTGRATTGAYLIWHPESWMLPHMVHGFGQFRYFRRDADRAEPVPMDERQVDRLYQLRISGEQRREAFLSGLWREVRPSEVPYIGVCLCPRLLLDRALDFSSLNLRQWIRDSPLFVDRDVGMWEPTSCGVRSVFQGPGEYPRIARIYFNGALSVGQRLADGQSGNYLVYFRRIVSLVYAVYAYAAKLYTHLARPYMELQARVLLDYMNLCTRFAVASPDREFPMRGPINQLHVLDEGVCTAEIIADLDRAAKPMLDRIWQAFGMGWEVPKEVVKEMLERSRW